MPTSEKSPKACESDEKPLSLHRNYINALLIMIPSSPNPSSSNPSSLRRHITYDHSAQCDGADVEQNYVFCPWPDMEAAAQQVRRCIDYAEAHPELQFSVYWMLLTHSELIPLFSMARGIDNITLPDKWLKQLDEQQIEIHDGVLTFAGQVRKPLMVQYHLLSNNIRYGVAEPKAPGDPHYFAFYGYPQRNDDYFQITQITETEYQEAMRDFSGIDSYLKLDAMAPTFNARYIEHRPIISEGNNLLPDVFWI